MRFFVFLLLTSERMYIFVTENGGAHSLKRGVTLTLPGERVLPFEG